LFHEAARWKHCFANRAKTLVHNAIQSITSVGGNLKLAIKYKLMTPMALKGASLILTARTGNECFISSLSFKVSLDCVRFFAEHRSRLRMLQMLPSKQNI
jgi:hypothetical protein